MEVENEEEAVLNGDMIHKAKKHVSLKNEMRLEEIVRPERN